MPNDPGAAPSSSTGSAGSRVTLACRGFGPSEPVDVSFGATALTTAKATAGGQVSAFLVVPSGFAGSPITRGERTPSRPSERVAETLGLALERHTDNQGRWPGRRRIYAASLQTSTGRLLHHPGPQR
jgi:hypothetical protein